jgi:hypothetical protein
LTADVEGDNGDDVKQLVGSTKKEEGDKIALPVLHPLMR